MNDIATNIMWTSLVILLLLCFLSQFVDKPKAGIKTVREVYCLAVGTGLLLSIFSLVLSAIIKIWS